MTINPLVALPATTFALGAWQVYRLYWKNGLQRRANYAVGTPPAPWEAVRESLFEGDAGVAAADQLAAPTNAKQEAIEKFVASVSPFRRITLTGEFLPLEMLVGPRTLSSVGHGEPAGSGGLGRPVSDGYLVVSPFRLSPSSAASFEAAELKIRVADHEKADSSDAAVALPRAPAAVERERAAEASRAAAEEQRRTAPAPSCVLVCRGWIPKTERDAAAARIISGPVEVETLLTQSHALPRTYDLNPLAALVVPPNVPDRNEWHSLNVGQMAEFASGVTTANSDPPVSPTLLEVTDTANNLFLLSRPNAPIARVPSVQLTNNHLSYAITWFGLTAFGAYMIANRGGKGGKAAARRVAASLKRP